MAKRTPGLQQRSLIHGYWGQFQYDTSVPPATYGGRTGDVGGTLLPNVGTPLSAAEFRKLEAGDTAATIDTGIIVGSQFGLWTCIYEGVAGVGGAVWVRMDNATSTQTQTIRDAHRIVVGIAGLTTGTPATDALLNLSPYTAGVSADFIDTGDGAGLVLAIATAAAMADQVDVRISSGTIDFEGASVSAPLAIPAGCRLIGAGSGLTAIEGRDTADQGIFFMSANSALEGVTLTSKAPTAAPGASLGIVQSTGVSGGNFKLNDVIINIEDDATRVAKVGVYCVAAGSGGTKSCSIDRVNVSVDNNLTTAGFTVEGYVRSSITNCTVTGATLGLIFNGGLGPAISGNEAGHISNFKGYNLFEAGIAVFVSAGQAAVIGLSISDSFISFNDADNEEDPQYVISLTSSAGAVIDQVSISGLQARWTANAQTANRWFGRIVTEDVGALVKGVRFVGCGAASGLAYSSPLTSGLVLNAFAEDSILGADLACDFGGAGLPPADVINVTGAGTAWEHAHPSGLA